MRCGLIQSSAKLKAVRILGPEFAAASTLSLFFLRPQLTDAMAAEARTWQEIAEKKRSSVLAKIHNEWRIQVPSAQEQKDVTGAYIEQYLDEDEVKFTREDAVTILRKIAAGDWRAADVTRAFCHRSALAHQLVSKAEHCILWTYTDSTAERLLARNVF